MGEYTVFMAHPPVTVSQDGRHECVIAPRLGLPWGFESSCGDLSGFSSSPFAGQVIADSEGAQTADDLDVNVVSPG